MRYVLDGERGQLLCPKCKSLNIVLDDNREDRDFGNMDIDAKCKDCEWEGYAYDES